LAFMAVEALAAPGRLAGFSGSQARNTGEFNQTPDRDEPVRPHYLDEENNDVRFAAVGNEDRYKLPGVHSLRELEEKARRRKQNKDSGLEENYDEDGAEDEPIEDDFY